MRNYFLTSLKIEGFRGINNEGEPFQISFKTDAVNSIFAANAQGKSSIFEALCFAIKGYVPKLAVLQRSEEADEYYVNHFHSGRTATIELTLQPDDASPAVGIRIRKLPDGSRGVDSPSGYPNPHQLLASLNSEFCLVDYRTFLKFVEDSPLNRGRAFSCLIGLSPVSEFRQALEVLANTRTLNSDLQITTLRSRLGFVKQGMSTVEAQLRGLFRSLSGQQLTGELDRTVIVEEGTRALRAVALVAPHFSQASILDADYDAIRATIRDKERSSDQERLRQITAIIGEIDPLSTDPGEDSEVSNLRALVEELETRLGTSRGPLLRTHYQSALNVLQSPDWKDPSLCPTCETTRDKSLVPELEEKLANYTDVEEAARRTGELWGRTVLSSRLAALLSSPHISSDPSEQKLYRELKARADTGYLSSADLNDVISLRTILETRRVSALEGYRVEQQNLQRELPPSLVTLTEQVGLAEQLKQRLQQFENSRSELTILQAKIDCRERWVKFITDACNTFAQAEVRLSTAKTLSVENDYREMYRQITSNPEVVPRLVKSSDSEDLYLVLERFYGQTNLKASPLLAESYRNALAVSIFLSSAIQTSRVSSFMVLDDVTSSFDAGHQFNLMELIRSKIARPMNQSGPQMIILSHDGLLEKYFDRISTEAPWYHQRIQGLAPKGAVFTQVQDSNRLRSNAQRLLLAGQVDQAEPLVRQYLEFKLLEIIDRIRIPVPIDFSIRDDRKMVQNCLDAINAGVSLHSRAGDLILTSAQSTALSSSLVPVLIANWVSHYATGASTSFTPYVLIGVLDTIDQVSDCFKYDCNCSGFTRRRYYRTLSSKHCSC